MRKKVLSIIMCVVLLISASTALIYAAANTKAQTLRLDSYKGTLTIKTGAGKKVSPSANLRLSSGYTLQTAKKSYAYLSLDGSKAVKMDQNTKVEIRKSGNKLEVYIKSGNIYCEVSEKLKGDESLNIRTNTMVTGVRGTEIQVSVETSVNNDNNDFREQVKVATAEQGIVVGKNGITIDKILAAQEQFKSLSGNNQKQSKTTVSVMSGKVDVHEIDTRSNKPGGKITLTAGEKAWNVFYDNDPTKFVKDNATLFDFGVFAVGEKNEDQISNEIITNTKKVVGDKLTIKDILRQMDEEEKKKEEQKQKDTDEYNGKVAEILTGSAITGSAISENKDYLFDSNKKEGGSGSWIFGPSNPGPVVPEKTTLTGAQLQAKLDALPAGGTLTLDSNYAVNIGIGEVVDIEQGKSLVFASGSELFLSSGFDGETEGVPAIINVYGTLTFDSGADVVNEGIINDYSGNSIYINCEFYNRGDIYVGLESETPEESCTGKLYIGGTLYNNDGSFVAKDGGETGYIYVSDDSELIINQGGTLYIEGPAINYLTGTINNSGTVILGSESVKVENMINNGTIRYMGSGEIWSDTRGCFTDNTGNYQVKDNYDSARETYSYVVIPNTVTVNVQASEWFTVQAITANPVTCWSMYQAKIVPVNEQLPLGDSTVDVYSASGELLTTYTSDYNFIQSVDYPDGIGPVEYTLSIWVTRDCTLVFREDWG